MRALISCESLESPSLAYYQLVQHCVSHLCHADLFVQHCVSRDLCVDENRPPHVVHDEKVVTCLDLFPLHQHVPFQCLDSRLVIGLIGRQRKLAPP